MSEARAVTVRGLTHRFGSRVILRDLDLRIAAGEFVALLGRSGSGKTTLLRILAGLEPVQSGSVSTPDSKSVVFQESRLLPWKRVLDNIALGLRVPDAAARAAAALREVGIDHRAQAWPLTLSGGEAQRAGVARALVHEPDLLLMDEPFGALDALTRLSMQSLVAALWQTHRPAVMLVTHDVEEALLLADRVVVMSEGRLIRQTDIPLARPRSAAEASFATQKLHLLEALTGPVTA